MDKLRRLVITCVAAGTALALGALVLVPVVQLFAGATHNAAVAEPLKLKPSEYFGRNIVITTTGVYSHTALLAAIGAMGIDNVMWSIDYPYANGDAPSTSAPSSGPSRAT